MIVRVCCSNWSLELENPVFLGFSNYIIHTILYILYYQQRILEQYLQNEMVNVDATPRPYLKQTNFLYEIVKCILQNRDLQRELVAASVSLDSPTVRQKLFETMRFARTHTQKKIFCNEEKMFVLGHEISILDCTRVEEGYIQQQNTLFFVQGFQSTFVRWGDRERIRE